MDEIMEQNKPILDATAGMRRMHFDRKNPNVLYIDEKAEVNPDVVADFKHLDFIASMSKKMVIFDPPHLIDTWQPNKDLDSRQFSQKFGLLKAETWQSDLRKGLLECWRVLDNYGVLLFKWSTHDKSVESIIKDLPFQPIIAEVTRNNPSSKHPNNKNSRFGANATLWVVYMKLPLNSSEKNEATL
jgi:hypothetical protein